jgi:hypothetical protein
MRTPTAVALAVAVVLALPAAAGAKGVAALAVCGQDRCHGVDAATVRATSDAEFVPRPAPRTEPWFLVRARAPVSDGRSAQVWTAEWLPRAGVMRTSTAEGDWIAPPRRLRAALDRAARGLPARPPSALAPGAGPTARVVETFSPADASGNRDAGAGLVAGAAGLAAALVLGVVALAVRRRSGRRARARRRA